MHLIANIIKESTRYKYSKATKESDTTGTRLQLEQLKKLVYSARKTHFGTYNKFNRIINSRHLVRQFKEEVPLTNYENFYNDWISLALSGNKDIFWSGHITNYALTSGTSGAASKKIPVSEEMLREFHRTSLRQIVNLHNFDLPSSFYDSKLLIIGGSTKLNKTQHYQEGDLSGILSKNKSIGFAPFTKPKNKTQKITDWNEKMEVIIEKAPNWNIGAIAGVPSWVLLLLERIIDRYNLKTIHDIWPNLKLYTHGGVFIDPYKEKLQKCFSEKVIFQNTYLASEGYFAYQIAEGEAMKLIINQGVFYEFIEEKYFNRINKGIIENIPTVCLNNVKPNENYALVISTCSGLWRYIIGDVISFDDTEKYLIKLKGRVASNINLMGEHLSEENIKTVMSSVQKKMNISIQEYCVYPSIKNNCHYWYIGTNDHVDINKLSVEINNVLCILNDDYNAVRKILLKKPQVKQLKPKYFYDFLQYQNKLGGQSKFPRVMTISQAKSWERFLNDTVE